MVSADTYIVIVMVMSVSYTLTFGFCMYQTNKFNYFNDDWRHTKVFYISVIIQTFIRMTTFALLTFAVPRSDRGNLLIVLMRSIPDTLFFINYTLLIYQTLNIFYHSHMENRLHISLLSHFTTPKFRTARKLLIILVFFWLSFMALIYALLILEKIDISDIDTEFTVVNLLSATLVLVYLAYLYSKYSETPFKSELDKQKLKIISRILFVWTIGRYFKGISGLLDMRSASLLSYLSDPQSSTVGGAFMYVSQIYVCEIICFVLVLSTKVIGIFISQDQANIHNKDQSGMSDSHSIEINSLQTIGTFLSENDLKVDLPFNKRKNGLGELFSAELAGQLVAFRKITFKRISENALDEVKKEAEELKSKNFPGVLSFFGVVVSSSYIGLVFEMVPRDLFKLIHEDKIILHLKQKFKMLKKLSMIISACHAKGEFHGHLSSRNVLVLENFSLKVSDFGFRKLKIYASKDFSYSNKSNWSSPEVLSLEMPVVVSPTGPDDVFSFGIIAWELITGEIPFEESFQTKKGQNDYRLPYIPSYFPKYFTKILESCWASAEKRATMAQISEKVNQLKMRE